MFDVFARKKTTTRVVSVLLVFSSLVSVWASFLYFDFSRRAQSKADDATRQAVNMLDQVFHYAELTNEAILNGVDADCKTQLPRLREVVELSPFLVDIRLAHDGRQYCSSLLGALSENDEPTSFEYGTMLLITEDVSYSQNSRVVLQVNKGSYSALSSINGLYLRMVMRVAQANTVMHFSVGSSSLNDAGVFEPSHSTEGAFALSVQRSLRLPYSVGAQVSYGDAWPEFWQEYSLLFFFLIALSALACVFCYRVKSKPLPIERELTQALAAHEFVPFFQPQVDGVTRQITGVEVLMRWQHHCKGLILPDMFIPQAEESGLIIGMTSILFVDVALFLKAESGLFPPGFHISINIAASHLDSDALLHDCRELNFLCKRHQWQLVLELTERIPLSINSQVASRLAALASMGVMLALDDFGTGNESFIALQQCNFHILKIDRSFINSVGDEKCSQHIVDGVIALAKKMNMTLVAEGVETTLQAQYLSDRGVQFLQGYIFGPPMSPEDFLIFMRNSSCFMLSPVFPPCQP